MEHYLPEIFWHDRKGLLSVDFQKKSETNDVCYKIVTTSMQKEVRIWELVFEKVKGERDGLAVNFVSNITGHQSAVNVARFSPDGSLLASADSGDLDNDDFPPNKENWIRLRAPLRHDSDVSAVCWSTDGMYLASVSNDESLVVQNVRTGKCTRLWSITSYRRFPNGVVWDPRGKYVVTMSTDRKLDILDAAKGTRLRWVCISLLLQLNCLGADFTPDGELLIAPCGHLEIDDSNVYGTYIFRRRDFDKDRPAAFLRSRKPTFCAVCSPVVFELRNDVEGNALGLPYRVVWATLTLDAVTFYDSQTTVPFSYLDGIHYNNLSDASWSSDGRILLVSSLEGYCSIIRFDLDCIGKVITFSLSNCPPSPVLIAPKKPKRVSKFNSNQVADNNQGFFSINVVFSLY
uniref:WD_REPEATS_REGION domain-containing protein n=1 Tax=Syphacia muris TaxID=451379 RepID=A0A0N5AQJ7_9BILA